MVVFSQWLGTHELLARRLAAGRPCAVPRWRAWRAAWPLVERFHNDDDCRIFLRPMPAASAEPAARVAGREHGPAVEPGGAGAAHRPRAPHGAVARRAVVNLIGQGTIEEGMLSVLAFKKTLFAGVLDGGEKEVFLGGSRLTKFMETVEKTTAAIGPSTVNVEQREPEGDRVIPAGSEEPETTIGRPAAGEAVTADPWTGLVQTGLAFLEQLATAASSRGTRDALA